MTSTRFERIDALVAALAEECQTADVQGANLDECVNLIGKLKAVGLSLDGLKVAAMGRVSGLQAVEREALSRGASRKPVPLGGQDRTMYDVMVRAGKQPRQAADREIKIAEMATESFPGFVEAMRHGKVSADYLGILKAVARTPELLQHAQADESKLIALAVEQDADEFRKSTRAWLFQNAPSVAEREVMKEERQEKISVFAADGGYKVLGWLTALNGTALNTVLREQVGVPSKDDQRQHAERNAEVLMQIVHGMGMNAASVTSFLPDGESLEGVGAQPRTHGAGDSTGSPDRALSVARPSGLRHQILVHVPLSTLVRTEEAIEAGCRVIEEKSQSSGGRLGERHASRRAKHGELFGSRNREDTHRLGESPVSPREAPEVGLDCPVDGGGLGRQGACLGSRAAVERDVGAVLGMIRAGIDVRMLEGFAPAKLSDGSPLAPSQLAQLLCDSDLARVVLTAHGEPIDASRAQRLFSPRQTKAVLARDQHCRFPGCSRGAEVGQVHHAQEWEKGGATAVDNAVLLCFHHHRYVHSKQISIAHHVGGFIFTERDGTSIGVTHHARALAA